MNGHINCPDFLNKYTFQTFLNRTRSNDLFYIKTQTKKYGTNAPLLRITNTVNRYYKIDPFCSIFLSTYFRRIVQCTTSLTSNNN